MKRKAFTLFEIMVVTAIIAVVMAITVSVLASAKKSAKRAVSISNLRQCGLSLAQYVADNGDNVDLPPIEEARILLARAPVCDPGDNWRSGCVGTLGDPMVGSYGYVRGLEIFKGDDGLRRLRSASNPIIMASIFYSDPEPPRFIGEYPNPADCPGGFCRMPTGILAVRMDCSVVVKKATFQPSPGVVMGFTWPNAFISDDSTWVKVP